MKQIKWFRNLFLIGATSFMLLSVAACNNKPKAEEKKKPAATEFKVEFSAKAPDGATISADDLKKLVVAKNGEKAINSGDKVAKDTVITFEFAKDAKGLALKEWKATGATIADAEKAKLSVKVKITADTTISAELEKAVTLASVKIHNAEVKAGKVSVANAKDKVVVGDISELKVAFYGTNKALKDDQAIASGFTVKNTTVNLTAGTEAEVTIVVPADNASGRPAGELVVKVLRRQIVDVTSMKVKFNNTANDAVEFGTTALPLAWNTDAVKATKNDLAAGAQIKVLGDISGLKGKIIKDVAHTLDKEIDAKDIVVKEIKLGSNKIEKAGDAALTITDSAQNLEINFKETDKYEFSTVKLNVKAS